MIANTTPTASEERVLRPGRYYRYYRGGVYHLKHVGFHTETRERLVVYTSLLTGDVWIRPYNQFIDRLESGELRFEEVLYATPSN